MSTADYSSYIGQKFHHLQIINFIYNKDNVPHKRYLFECKCDCGRTCFKKCNDVIHYKVQTCADKECEYNIFSHSCVRNKYTQYINQKINHLTILDITYNYNDKNIHRTKFKCKCDCGNIVNLDIHS